MPPVGLLGQAALLALRLEYFRQGRLADQPALLQLEQLDEFAVEKGQAGVQGIDGDRGIERLQHLDMGLDMTVEVGFGLFELADILRPAGGAAAIAERSLDDFE
ncbi:MAG: hypothetical protein CMM31_03090 [Rhodospirillaceae bacterium]|nr:hypothetical protein [Rhodospirillaceae bacterium]